MDVVRAADEKRSYASRWMRRRPEPAPASCRRRRQASPGIDSRSGQGFRPTSSSCTEPTPTDVVRVEATAADGSDRVRRRLRRAGRDRSRISNAFALVVAPEATSSSAGTTRPATSSLTVPSAPRSPRRSRGPRSQTAAISGTSARSTPTRARSSSISRTSCPARRPTRRTRRPPATRATCRTITSSSTTTRCSERSRSRPTCGCACSTGTTAARPSSTAISSLFGQAIQEQADVTDGDLIYRGQSSWWITIENGVVTEIEEQYAP